MLPLPCFRKQTDEGAYRERERGRRRRTCVAAVIGCSGAFPPCLCFCRRGGLKDEDDDHYGCSFCKNPDLVIVWLLRISKLVWSVLFPKERLLLPWRLACSLCGTWITCKQRRCTGGLAVSLEDYLTVDSYRRVNEAATAGREWGLWTREEGGGSVSVASSHSGALPPVTDMPCFGGGPATGGS